MLPARALLVLALILGACDPTEPKPDTGEGQPGVDADGDGYTDDVDCDDGDAEVHPGADERCNGVDDDCDGFVDADDPSLVDGDTFWLDTDGDGFGDPDTALIACELPSGAVTDDRDCDDSDAAVNPDAVELCNGIDDDCDGLYDDADPDASGSALWYTDGDGDGYGLAGTAVESCSPPSGTVLDDSDCDDEDASVNPGATELCNGVDDDCDTLIDEADPDLADVTTWYADDDGDGYGDAATSAEACDPPIGYVADDSDCNDTDASVNPAADEVCGGGDEDCDGLVNDDDPSVVDPSTWYADADNDGFGDPDTTTTACNRPTGYLADASDCDDLDAYINPDAPEICDEQDNDCDGLVDDDDSSVNGTTVWFADADSDGYGDSDTRTTACDQPSGYVSDNTDCDDVDAAVNPAATEVCDGVDNDCSGRADEDSAVDVLTWYADADGDGYGDPKASDIDCDQPLRHVSDNTDCDDTASGINPGAVEICDSLDNDCDGLIDDDDGSLSTTRAWYADADGDGYGDLYTPSYACSAPSGTVSSSTDCDDTDAAINPAAFEVCDGVDNDCDGLTDSDDDSLRGATTYYFDADGDGFGDILESTAACSLPSGYVVLGTDCDDSDPSISPAATEDCNGVDDDCDGTLDDAGDCPCNLESYDGHSYLFCEDEITWWKAYEGCLSVDNFDLVIIEDSTENAWVFSTAYSYDPWVWWWMGLHNQDATSSEEPDGAWEWVDGSALSWDNWNSSQPDDGWSDEDCAHMYGDSGTWNDLDCDDSAWGSTPIYYICESQ